MQSLCLTYLKVKTMKNYLSILNSLHRHFLKFNDGASNFNNGAEYLMMEHFNIMIDRAAPS